MARWTRVSGPREYAAAYGRAKGWEYELGDASGEVVTVAVEVAAAAWKSTSASEASQRAMESEGWLAVAPFVNQKRLPRRLLVSHGGVSVSEEGDD